MAPSDPLGLFQLLCSHDVEMIVIGGQAAVIHGSILPTEDLDITPDPAPENLERLAGALREVGARLRVAGEPGGVSFDVSGETMAGAEIWNLQTDLGDLDVNFLPAGTGGFADLRRDARSISLGEITVVVASLDDVIRSKRAAGRPKDQAALPMLEALREASR